MCAPPLSLLSPCPTQGVLADVDLLQRITQASRAMVRNWVPFRQPLPSDELPESVAAPLTDGLR